MVYHLVTVEKLKIDDNFYDIGLIYYQKTTSSYRDQKYNLDVLIPRSLEFVPKAELHKYLQPFRMRKSVFSEKCLAYADFICPLYGSFLHRRHPKFKGLSAHEYYLGIPLRTDLSTENENDDENDTSSDSDYDD